MISWLSKGLSAVANVLVPSELVLPPDLDLNQDPRDLVETAWEKAQDEHERIRAAGPDDETIIARSKLPHYLDAMVHALVREARIAGEGATGFATGDREDGAVLDRSMFREGDCVVFLLESRVIEKLCAIGTADTPPGTMALVLVALREILMVRPQVLLPSEMVHKAVNHLAAVCINRRRDAATGSTARRRSSVSSQTGSRSSSPQPERGADGGQAGAAAAHGAAAAGGGGGGEEEEASGQVSLTYRRVPIAQRMLTRLAHSIWLSIGATPSLLTCFYTERTALSGRGTSQRSSITASMPASSTAAAPAGGRTGRGSLSSTSSSGQSQPQPQSHAFVNQELVILEAVLPWVHAAGSSSQRPNFADQAREALLAAFALRDARVMGFVLHRTGLLQQLAARAAEAFRLYVAGALRVRTVSPFAHGSATGGGADDAAAAAAAAGGVPDVVALQRMLALVVERLAFINALLLAGGVSPSCARLKQRAALRQRQAAAECSSRRPRGSLVSRSASRGDDASEAFAPGGGTEAASSDGEASDEAPDSACEEAAPAPSSLRLHEWPSMLVPGPDGLPITLPEDALASALLAHTARTLCCETIAPALTARSEQHASAAMACLAAVMRQLYACSMPPARLAASSPPPPTASPLAASQLAGCHPVLHLLQCVLAGASPCPPLPPLCLQPALRSPAPPPLQLACFAPPGMAAVRSALTAAVGSRSSTLLPAAALRLLVAASSCPDSGRPLLASLLGPRCLQRDASLIAALSLCEGASPSARVLTPKVTSPSNAEAAARRRAGLGVGVGPAPSASAITARRGSLSSASGSPAAAAAAGSEGPGAEQYTVPETASCVLWLRLHAAALAGVAAGDRYRQRYGTPTPIGGPAGAAAAAAAGSPASSAMAAAGSAVSFGEWAAAAAQAAAAAREQAGLRAPAAGCEGAPAEGASAAASAAAAPRTPRGSLAGSGTPRAPGTPGGSSSSSGSNGGGGSSVLSSVKASDAEIFTYCHGWAGLDSPPHTGATPAYLEEACRGVTLHQMALLEEGRAEAAAAEQLPQQQRQPPAAGAGEGGVASSEEEGGPSPLYAALLQRLRQVTDSRFDRDSFLMLTQLLAGLAHTSSASLHCLLFGQGGGAAAGAASAGGVGGGARDRARSRPSIATPAPAAAGQSAAGGEAASPPAAAAAPALPVTVLDVACDLWSDTHHRMAAFASSASVACEALAFARAALGMEGGDASFISGGGGSGADKGGGRKGAGGGSSGWTGLRAGASPTKAHQAGGGGHSPFAGGDSAALARLSPEAAVLVREKRCLLEGYLTLQEALRELAACLDAKARLGAVLV